MMLNQYLNSWTGSAYVRIKPTFQGIMGLPDQAATDLWLGDGTYSLWNREEPSQVDIGQYPTPNSYGSVPFVMGSASDDQKNVWFGIYSNVAAAQDWEIENEEANG